MVKQLKISIHISNPEIIKEIALGDEYKIKKAGTVIAQSKREANQESPFFHLPEEIIIKIVEFLCLPDSTPMELLYIKFNTTTKQNYFSFYRDSTFKTIIPVKEKGVRESIGATVCLNVNEGMITREEGEKGHKIAQIDFSSEGMVLKFISSSYGKQFFYALKNAEYNSVSCEAVEKVNDSNYIFSVKISTSYELKRFVINTCGYKDKSLTDLLDSTGVKLSGQFFIDELTSIGEKNQPSEHKAAMAKDLIDKYLPYLDPSQAKNLKTEIESKVVLDDSIQVLKKHPFEYLTEYRGLGKFFKYGGHGLTETYKRILKVIDKKMEESLNEGNENGIFTNGVKK
jgi:hypothetical protein